MRQHTANGGASDAAAQRKVSGAAHLMRFGSTATKSGTSARTPLWFTDSRLEQLHMIATSTLQGTATPAQHTARVSANGARTWCASVAWWGVPQQGQLVSMGRPAHAQPRHIHPTAARRDATYRGTLDCRPRRSAR